MSIPETPRLPTGVKEIDAGVDIIRFKTLSPSLGNTKMNAISQLDPPAITEIMCDRISMFDFEIDVMCMDEAVDRILSWARDDNFSCRFVVTPNVDHAVMLQERDDVRRVYEDAHLILADGFPLIVASRILKKPLPERVAGSELVPLLFAKATSDQPVRVFLLGAAPGVADRAAGIIHDKWKGVEIVGTYSPPLGFEHDDDENRKIEEMVSNASPDILVLGLGAPKQELWIHQHRENIHAKVALCVGATIDFIAGEKPQAPVWMRRSGLEWIHRVISEPRRLAKRYARDAWVFPQLVWKDWRHGNKQ